MKLNRGHMRKENYRICFKSIKAKCRLQDFSLNWAVSKQFMMQPIITQLHLGAIEFILLRTYWDPRALNNEFDQRTLTQGNAIFQYKRDAILIFRIFGNAHRDKNIARINHFHPVWNFGNKTQNTTWINLVIFVMI